MAIEFNIGLRALQTYGEEASRNQALMLNQQAARIQQQAADQRAYVFERGVQQDQARPGIIAQARRGDFQGAQDAAAGAGDFDIAKIVDGMRDDQLQQFQQQADVVGSLAPRLKALPVEQRAAAAAPILTQAGFTPQQLATMDWSDDGVDAQYQLSAAGKAAVAARMKAAEPYTLSPGSKRYVGDQVIADNPAIEKPIWDSESGSLIYPSGFAGTAGYADHTGGRPNPSPSRGRTQFGWTPRERNGGDNSDAAVDTKINGMSRFLRLGPNDTFPESMSPIQIARALALSEGGAGSLADRNNNPGNLRDPRTGAYRRFATKEDGLQAAAAQVRRNLARGQNTIATMVEGLPVGGGQPQGGGGQVVNVRPPKSSSGNAPSGYRFNGDRLEPIPGGPADPTGPTSRNVQSNRKAEADFRKEFEQDKNYTEFHASRTSFNQLRDLVRKKGTHSGADDLAIIFNFMRSLDPASVVREGEFMNAANSRGLIEGLGNRFQRAKDGQWLNPKQREEMLRTAYTNYQSRRAAYNTRADQFRGYASDNGINPDRVARTYTPDKPQRGAPIAIGQSSKVGGFTITRTK